MPPSSSTGSRAPSLYIGFDDKRVHACNTKRKPFCSKRMPDPRSNPLARKGPNVSHCLLLLGTNLCVHFLYPFVPLPAAPPLALLSCPLLLPYFQQILYPA